MLVIFSFSIFVIKGTLCGVNEAPFVFVVSFHITTFSRLQNKHKNTAVLCIHTLLQSTKSVESFHSLCHCMLNCLYQQYEILDLPGKIYTVRCHMISVFILKSPSYYFITFI